MMSFNPTFNPQLLAAAAAQMPSTPTRPDASSAPAGAQQSPEDAVRAFLAQIGAGGAPPALFGGAAAAAAAAVAPPMPQNSCLPFPFMVQQNDIKPEMLAAAAAAAGAAPGGGPIGIPFMDFPGFHPYGMDGVRRKNATRETTAPLKGWLSDHRKNPYPTKAEKVFLACITKMTLTQVSTWFANARRRLKKENKMTWSPRNRPGEDDDDLADLERPGSSKSDMSDDHNESNNNQSPHNVEDSPRKPKSLWSIADTVGVKSDEDSSSKAASTSPAAGTAAEAAGGQAAMLAAMAAAWQHQMAARQMMAQMQMLAGTPVAPGPAPHPFALMQAMQARLAAAPGGALSTSALNGVLAGIPVSSLSPSSSTHSSDAEKPPTLIDATAEDVSEDYIVKKEETPETPESN